MIFHSSEIVGGLCLMKCSSEMLQKWSYFWNMKTHVVFLIIHFMLLYFFSNECPGLCLFYHFSSAKSRLIRNWSTFRINYLMYIGHIIRSFAPNLKIFWNISKYKTIIGLLDLLYDDVSVAFFFITDSKFEF